MSNYDGEERRKLSCDGCNTTDLMSLMITGLKDLVEEKINGVSNSVTSVGKWGALIFSAGVALLSLVIGTLTWVVRDATVAIKDNTIKTTVIEQKFEDFVTADKLAKARISSRLYEVEWITEMIFKTAPLDVRREWMKEKKNK